MNEIRVYTDGSAILRNHKCSGTLLPGCGGIGIYIVDGEREVFYQKGYYKTKTGRCEVRALLTALRLIEDKSRFVMIFSDSEYVVKTINEKWIYRWELEKWFDRTNADLWKQVLEEYRKFPKGNIKMIHIKGHQKDLSNIHILGNNIADTLADYKQFEEYEEDLRV